MTAPKNMTRPELNDFAKRLGIENADDTSVYAKKDDLVDVVDALIAEGAIDPPESISTTSPGESTTPVADDVPAVEIDKRGRIVVPDGFVFNGHGYERKRAK